MDFVDEARREAMKSPMKHKYGCLLIYRNKIVSRGYNSYSSSSLNHPFDTLNSHIYSTHAEKNCIRKVDRRLLGRCYMILVRLSNDKLVRCIPCESCSKLIDKYRISKIICLYDEQIDSR